MNESMPESHRQQISAGRKESLNRAGIGAKYHDMTLKDIPAGEDILEFLRTGGVEALQKGKLILLSTQTANGFDTVMTFARAVHLNGFGCRVVDLPKLTRMVDLKNYDAMGELVAIKTLVIVRFFDGGINEDCPYTPFHRRQIESILLDRVAEGKPSILHLSLSGVVKLEADRQQSLRWWTDEFQALACDKAHAAILRLTK